jgi:hypothetical protein
MRKIIKKILKEDFNPEDFSWVNTELEPIRDDKHRYDLISGTIAKVKEYKGWRINQDNFDGVVYWWGQGYTGMATPEWGEDFEIPVDITWATDGNDDNHDNVVTIPTPHFKYVIEVEDWYSTKYFELVYNELTDYINNVLEN